MWGVSDPAGHLWGDDCDAKAGSLTPHPCRDTCAGALTGRHSAPPESKSLIAENVMLSKSLRCAHWSESASQWRTSGSRINDGWGPTAP